MRHKSLFRLLLIISIVGMFFFQCLRLSAGEPPKIKAGADLVNRFVWRGMLLGEKNPQIQPSLTATWKRLELGAWGTWAVNSNYSEYDFYAKVSFDHFAVMLTNYNVPSLADVHYAEFTVSAFGGEKFPLYANVNKYVLNDISWYLDAGIRFNQQKAVKFDFNIGMTPQEGDYGPHGGIVHISLKGNYDLPLTKKFRLPLFAQIVNNPQAEKWWGVVGVTIPIFQ